MSYWLIKSKEEDKFFNGFKDSLEPNWEYATFDGSFRAVIFSSTRDKVNEFIKDTELDAEPFYLNKG